MCNIKQVYDTLTAINTADVVMWPQKLQILWSSCTVTLTESHTWGKFLWILENWELEKLVWSHNLVESGFMKFYNSFTLYYGKINTSYVYIKNLQRFFKLLFFKSIQCSDLTWPKIFSSFVFCSDIEWHICSKFDQSFFTHEGVHCTGKFPCVHHRINSCMLKHSFE